MIISAQIFNQKGVFGPIGQPSASLQKHDSGSITRFCRHYTHAQAPKVRSFLFIADLSSYIYSLRICAHGAQTAQHLPLCLSHTPACSHNIPGFDTDLIFPQPAGKRLPFVLFFACSHHRLHSTAQLLSFNLPLPKLSFF
jgi:hypothetical protein